MFLSATGIQSSNLSVTLLLKKWFPYILVLYLNVINFQTFLSFFSGWGFSEHVRHLGFYDAYTEAPV